MDSNTMTPGAYIGANVASVVIIALIALIGTFVLVGTLFMYTSTASSTQKKIYC